MPSEDKSSHEKNDENGERPPRMSAAQKKAQERAELNADLATVCAKDRLTESCQSYIEAHQEVRQYLLDSGSMCLGTFTTLCIVLQITISRLDRNRQVPAYVARVIHDYARKVLDRLGCG